MTKRKRTKKGSSGFHIAHTIGKPPRLLNDRGEFTVGGGALFFMTPSGASEYAKKHKLDLSGVYGIVQCECSSIEQLGHTYSSEE